MDKKRFLKLMGSDDDSVLRLYELLKASSAGRYVYSSEFFTANIWKKAESLHILSEDEGFLPFFGGERRIFTSDMNRIPGDLVLITLKNKYPKNQLRHKDYLGSLMALGIEREKFSDLVVSEDTCRFLTFRNLYPHIRENLEKAGHNALEIIVDDSPESDELNTIRIKFEEVIILAPSMRIDALVSEIIKGSRSEAERLIKSGDVSLNYEKILDRAKDLRIDDIITVRGSGKYIVSEILGMTKKERYRIKLDKYI